MAVYIDEIDNPYGERTQPIYGDVPQYPNRPRTEEPDEEETPDATPDPWDTPPADGDWKLWFLTNVQGLTPNSATLKSLEEKLKKHGIKIIGNAAGTIFDTIQLPDGTMVDVGGAFSSGNPSQMSWTWQLGGGDAGGTGETGEAFTGAEIPAELVGPLLEPWTEQFSFGSFLPPDEFQPPDADAIFEDPGFMTRLREGQKALERSAAAKGTLLTGGTLKGLLNFNQEMASQEYGNVYGRRASEYDRSLQNAIGDYTRDYTQALDDYERRYNISMANQDRPFNKLSALAGLGQTTTPYMNFNSNIGNLYGQGANAWNNYLLQGANANAAGQIGSANAWSGAMGSLGNSLWSGLFLNKLLPSSSR